jgi:hypothetical protein
MPITALAYRSAAGPGVVCVSTVQGRCVRRKDNPYDAALVLRAKDEGLPMPAALVPLTPQLDLTESGDSFQTNLGIDILTPLMPINRLYANGHDLAHPYLSPLPLRSAAQPSRALPTWRFTCSGGRPPGSICR